jgi:succinoglycan biosynthesis transport protein ExoP
MMQSRYGDKHPDLIRARQEVADIDTQIQQEVARVLASLESNAQAAHGRLASIEGSVNSARGALVSNNRASIQLAELERNAQAVRTLYEGFLGRYKEISSQEGITSADARIVSDAQVPGAPSSPNIPLNMAVGTLLAAALGVAAVLLRELCDSTLSTADDVQRRLMLPYLGGLPLLESVTKRREPPTAHIASCPTSGFSEAVRALGAAIRIAQGAPPKLILVTSALPNEGKTVTAICLARALAMQGHKTLYVDCDLRRASGTASIGVRPTAGLLEVLDGEVELDRVIFKDPDTGASFLPSKLPHGGSRDVFGLPAMDELLDRLRNEYEMVILDTAPVLAIAETRILARKADAVALLAAWRQTPQKAVENALDILEAVGAPVTGLALTKVDLRVQVKTGYGDPTMFYKQYAAYYTETPRIPAMT